MNHLNSGSIPKYFIHRHGPRNRGVDQVPAGSMYDLFSGDSEDFGSYNIDWLTQRSKNKQFYFISTTMKNLQVLIKFRNNTSQTLQKNVATGEKIDLAVLHQNILTLQKETNDILTAEVENEKRTGSTTMKNSHGSYDRTRNE